jgi:hypothetical protein
MLPKATTALAALLVLGTASVVWADANNRADGSFAQCPVSMVSNGRTGVVNDAGKPLIAEKNRLFVPLQPDLAQGDAFRRGTTGETIVWIKLTEPGGN